MALRWMLIGALLSLVPLAGTVVLSRLTIAPALAFDAAQAFAIYTAGAAALRSSVVWKRSLYAVLSALLTTLALILPATRSYDGAHYMNGSTNLERRWVERADFGVESLAGCSVFVLASRDFASSYSLPYVVHALGRAMPEKTTLLSPVWNAPQTLTRTDAHSFELVYPRLSNTWPVFNGSVYRAEHDALRAGDIISTEDFQVHVLEALADQPLRLEFTFRRALDDPKLLFMASSKRQFERVQMPRIGERLVIAPAGGP